MKWPESHSEKGRTPFFHLGHGSGARQCAGSSSTGREAMSLALLWTMMSPCIERQAYNADVQEDMNIDFVKVKNLEMVTGDCEPMAEEDGHPLGKKLSDDGWIVATKGSQDGIGALVAGTEREDEKTSYKGDKSSSAQVGDWNLELLSGRQREAGLDLGGFGQCRQVGDWHPDFFMQNVIMA